MKRIILILLILTIIFTTGCWDMVEINQRIFPFSVGYDLSGSEEERFNITFTYPNINALGKNAIQEKRVHVITEQANDIFGAVHSLSTRLQYPIYNKHLKVLVMQEDVARDSEYVREIVDGINRDFVINKTLYMAVVRQSAQTLLELIPGAERQEVLEGTLNSLLINTQKSSSFTPKKLADFIEDMDNTGASVVPVANSGGEEVEFSGGAIFKDYQLNGYIDHMENKSIAILNNVLTEDGFHTDFKDRNLSILATNFNLKKRLEDSENLKITYYVEIEGQIHEYILPNGGGIDSKEMISEMEDSLANTIQMDLNNIIKKLQKEYKADVIKASDYLRKYHNKLWKQVEEDWEEVFSNADIQAEVSVKIRRRGLTN